MRLHIHRRGPLRLRWFLCSLAIATTSAHAAGTPEQKCEAAKFDASGKYVGCMARAERMLVQSGSVEDYDVSVVRCENALSAAWTKAESAAFAAGTTCPTLEDGSYVLEYLAACVDAVAEGLSGAGLPEDVATCNTALEACLESPAQPQKTGQTLCWSTTPSYPAPVVPCAGTGQDGETRTGVASSFSDNGDGTLTDAATGLVWEKLDDRNLQFLGDVSHDKDDVYSWFEAYEKVDELNLEQFAGHSDWRLPNIRELASILDYGGYPRPSLRYHPAFQSSCHSSCDSDTCSCVQDNAPTWSSTTSVRDPQSAWVVDADGYRGPQLKSFVGGVRAVRGGA